MEPTIDYRTLSAETPGDVFDQLARIHQEVIAQGFLTSLGRRFLGRLYRAAASSPHAVVVAARRGSEVLGFACGATDTGKFYRDFLLRWGALSVPLVLPKLLTPGRVRRVFETLLFPAKKENQELPAAQVLNFCVTPSSQGQGVGRRLYAELVDELRRRNVDAIKIVTGADQHDAQRFYEAAGAAKIGQLSVHAETPSVVYVHHLPPAPPDADASNPGHAPPPQE